MIKFIKEGKLTIASELLLFILIILGFFGVPYFNFPLWIAIPLYIISIISAFILMFEGRASAIGLKPFSNDPLGWRKIKKENDQKNIEKERKVNEPD